MIGIVYFRTDANDIIATGHVMRCLTLAAALVKKGQQVSFVVSDRQSEELIRNAGYDIHTLGTDWKIWDISVEKDFFRQHAANDDILVVDSYSVTGEYIGAMTGFIKTAVFDDIFAEYYPADIIINYNLYYGMFDYNKRYFREHCGNTKLLLGGDYVPLREQFKEQVVSRWQTDIEKKQPVELLLICGGGDIFNTMGHILENAMALDRTVFGQIRWHVVCGAYNPHYSDIKKISDSNSNVIIHKNVSNMAKLMSECDVCVSAASTVLYECCAMQLPTVFYCVADNQQYDVECFGRDEMMLYCGDFTKEPELTASSIIHNLKKVIGSNERYRYMVRTSNDMVDKNGADNIADELINIIGDWNGFT